MGDIFLSDFKYGLNRQRPRVAGLPGTLWDAKNVHITRGGDIERPLRFTPTYALPAGQTFGLGAVGGQVYTFGSVSNAAVPNGVQYQQLTSPAADAMTQVLDARAVGGALYVIAKYASGNIYHFYNGTRVTDWDALATTNGNFNNLAIYLADVVNADANVTAIAAGQTITVTANVAGTPFSLAASESGGASGTLTLSVLQPNVVVVPETLAQGTIAIIGGSSSPGVNKVTQITANGVSLMTASVDWTLSNDSTASGVAAAINNNTAATGFTALAVSNIVTITTKPGTGATPNGQTVAGTLGGNVAATYGNLAAGVTAVAAVAQIVQATFASSYTGTDAYTLTVNGTAYIATGNASGTGKSLYVYQHRMWSPENSLWEYCKLDTFTDWSTVSASSGAGFINISNASEGSEPLVGAGTYIGQSAIFSRRNCQIYNLAADATTINLAQTIQNTGALSARSILNYGTTDLFYLDETGIRSLKARDASGEAFVNDLGSAIDSFVRPNIKALPFGQVQRACAVVEPIDGRFWLAVGPLIYVLSYFPDTQINAWSYLDPGFTVSDFARAYNKLYVRAGDTVYLYGGASGAEYPIAGEAVAEVDLPFVATSPPSWGMLAGFDIACSGAWQCQALTDSNDETAQIDVGTLTETTYNLEDIGLQGRYTYIAFNLKCSTAGPATISNLCVHHDGKEPNN